MLTCAKKRAGLRGLAFSLVLADITIPEACPILGIPLMRGTREYKDCAPTLDRINNSRGYTPDNVRVISYRANRLKSDATLEELRALVTYMEVECKKE